MFDVEFEDTANKLNLNLSEIDYVASPDPDFSDLNDSRLKVIINEEYKTVSLEKIPKLIFKWDYDNEPTCGEVIEIRFSAIRDGIPVKIPKMKFKINRGKYTVEKSDFLYKILWTLPDENINVSIRGIIDDESYTYGLDYDNYKLKFEL